MHTIPKLHPKAKDLSFIFYLPIQKAAKEIIGWRHIIHASVNIFRDNSFLYLSSTPELGNNLINNGYLTVDGSTSPTSFFNRSEYFWSDTYDIEYKENIYKFKENNHGITEGIVLVHEINKSSALMTSLGFTGDPKKLRSISIPLIKEASSNFLKEVKRNINLQTGINEDIKIFSEG